VFQILLQNFGKGDDGDGRFNDNFLPFYFTGGPAGYIRSIGGLDPEGSTDIPAVDHCLSCLYFFHSRGLLPVLSGAGKRLETRAGGRSEKGKFHRDHYSWFNFKHGVTECRGCSSSARNYGKCRY